MSTMSLQVANQRTNADRVISSIDAHGDELSDALTRCDEELPEEQRLGREALFRTVIWLRDMLRQRVNALMQAEMDYIDEQADDPAARAERDRCAGELHAVMSQGRERVAKTLGAQALADYGMRQAAPARNQHIALADYAAAVVKLMRAKPQSVADAFGTALSLEQLANAIDERLIALKQSLAKVQQERRELDAAMLHRDSSQEALSEGYYSIAGALTNLYRLGGLTGLAERVKPTVRRSRPQDRQDAGNGAEDQPDSETGDTDAGSDAGDPTTSA